MIIVNDIYITKYKNINILELIISLTINEQVWNKGLGVQGQPSFPSCCELWGPAGPVKGAFVLLSHFPISII